MRLARRARQLSWASLAWLGVEGGLGVAAGALASSVALVAFGLGTNAAVGLWWFDPAVALLIAAVCVVEGRRGWRGQDCGCGACAAPPDPADQAASTCRL